MCVIFSIYYKVFQMQVPIKFIGFNTDFVISLWTKKKKESDTQSDLSIVYYIGLRYMQINNAQRSFMIFLHSMPITYLYKSCW